MLPKFANHLFGHFPRSSGSAFRNGFFNSSQGPSAGGAKYNAGSRFHSYNGYNGAGRAVTQASALGPDEDRQPRLQRLSLLPRSNGAILTPSARSRLLRVRSNSTSAALHPSSEGESQADTLNAIDLASPSATPQEPAASPPPITDPAAPQSVAEPQPPPEYKERRDFEEALVSGSYEVAVKAVEKFKATCGNPTTADYNAALHALLKTYSGDAPIDTIISTYHDMLEKNLLPNGRTYNIMIHALCIRDLEVQRIINVIELRMKHRELMLAPTSRESSATSKAAARNQGNDVEALEGFKSETNFNSALVMFQAASRTKQNMPLEMITYCMLLRACSDHKAVDAAIRIFAHYERFSNAPALPWMYEELISVHGAARDIIGAQEVFDEFKKQSAAGKIQFMPFGKDTLIHFRDHFHGGRSGTARIGQLRVWNEMIKAHFRSTPPNPGAALALLEEMLDTPNGINFAENEPPMPSQQTYDALIDGFISMGDLSTACNWFERLTNQSFVPVSSIVPCVEPPRPGSVSWGLIINKLASLPGKENVERMNGIWRQYEARAPEDRVKLRTLERMIVIRANLAYIRESDKDGSMDPADKKDKVEFLGEITKFEQGGHDSRLVLLTASAADYAMQFATLSLEIGQPQEALRAIFDFGRQTGEALANPKGRERSKEELGSIRSQVSSSLSKLLVSIFDSPDASYDIKEIVDICLKFSDETGMVAAGAADCAIRKRWDTERANGVPELSARQWSELLLQVCVRYERFNSFFPQGDEMDNSPDILTLIKDFSDAGIPLDQCDELVGTRLLSAIYRSVGMTEGRKFIFTLGPHLQGLLDVKKGGRSFLEALPVSPEKAEGASLAPIEYDTPSEQPAPLNNHFVIDTELSRSIDEYYPMHRTLTPYDGLKRLEHGLEQGLYPRPEAVGRLINALGRLKNLDTAKELYGLAQQILLTMGDNKHEQSLAWFQVEDQMIIALAHGGDMEAAHNHRQRILSQGGAPSSDAYGALISGIKDTTDDVTYALNLWQESQQAGVTANPFLYNTIISRLAKGRKAEQALELFQQMKARKLFPNTITYGAVITACCRVGDAASAESLFEEMTFSKRYVPRVPPFNTIMQLFVATKPDREKVLSYYKEMRKAGVRPSDHTYKLLLDAYGSVQPFDTEGMEKVFQDLLRDSRVTVNGTHWASRINAYGCAKKDLDKAFAIFDEIGSTTPGLPDPICFEALLNVLVTNHRTDRFSEVTDRMAKLEVRMTAYCANLMIKGYAVANDMDKAREIFESMADPAFGVAAPDNHASHETAQVSPPLDSPIYREPSTWEAMVRAELGSSNRDAALALIERMQTRGYPQAVLARVNGILHDDTATPKVDSSPVSSPSDTASSHPPPSSGVSTPPSSIF